MGYNTTGYITKNFRLEEFANTKATDEVKMVVSPEFIEHVQMLQELRNYLGYPLTVSSGYRTKKFNTACGGSSNSAHLDARATDVTSIPQKDFAKATEAWKLICLTHGKVGGINYYTWGCHLCSYEDKFGNTTFTIRDKR